MLSHLSDYRIILASQSPRRQELLRGLDIPFAVRVLPDVDESFPLELRAGNIPLYLAKKKSEAYHSIMLEDVILITADTIVWLDDHVLGKPADQSEAVKMLKKLSGKIHHVYTGVCVRSLNKQVDFVADSKVHFSKLTEEEIQYYVERYHPLDKAGSYGVQEWIGYIGVKSIEGSFYNVMGLPIHQLYEILKMW
ncbi:Maf-like protein [Microbacter margulisiae]|uniref:dTTP/UTP pyrophosphatase n=1 Tax=Microbacter margulisiae TaxID=1350067 RepID=A0A7W5DQJ9_9PORP|nr:Maf-like protein [Microbacter margulisiae]MBB3187141.1 septum formation protein [Microbacter margulisiae]